MAQLAENLSQLQRAGFEFESWLRLIEDEQIAEVGRNTSFPLHPSHYWTHHRGQQAVGFIGRVETFEADYRRMCNALGVESTSDANANVDAPENELAGDMRGYRYADRMSSRARRRVNELFRDDFELFGYERLD